MHMFKKKIKVIITKSLGPKEDRFFPHNVPDDACLLFVSRNVLCWNPNRVKTLVYFGLPSRFHWMTRNWEIYWTKQCHSAIPSRVIGNILY